VFVDGEKYVTLRGEGITDEFLELIETYVRTHYSSRFDRDGA
jgi:(E)-4-hydroxy-3-methylbut-2-enyl-diphosphate synthase